MHLLPANSLLAGLHHLLVASPSSAPSKKPIQIVTFVSELPTFYLLNAWIRALSDLKCSENLLNAWSGFICSLCAHDQKKTPLNVRDDAEVYSLLFSLSIEA